MNFLKIVAAGLPASVSVVARPEAAKAVATSAPEPLAGLDIDVPVMGKQAMRPVSRKTPFGAAIAAVALATLGAPGAALAADAPVTEAAIAGHIKVLAGDAFEGRAPGTAGEDRTIAYIVGEWAKAGIEPVPGSSTPWLQPVPLVESQPVTATMKFKADGREFTLADDDIFLFGDDASASLVDVPVVFVGYGVDGTGKVNADVKGKLAIMLYDYTPFGKELPCCSELEQLLAGAGAVGVISITPNAKEWVQLREWAQEHRAALGEKKTRPADAKAGLPISGYLSLEAVDALFARAGQNGAAAREAAKSPEYRGSVLTVTANLAATSAVRRYDSHNVIAKLPGARPDGKAVLFLGHWDHLGICAPDDPKDRICNGAVDNASGIAVLIEVAKRLASGARPDRDIYFMATTAEEMGLFGAEYFANHPVVPLRDITVALNIDTIAISPRGMPVATVGRGQPAYDAVVRDVATKLGRKIDDDGEADAFVERQDGWALSAKGVTSLMVGGSFSDMPLLDTFLKGNYHGRADEFSDKMPLGGAAEDADLHVALGRAFADTQRWPGK